MLDGQLRAALGGRTAGPDRGVRALAQLPDRSHPVAGALPPHRPRPLADVLQQDAAALPHPALERAARAHADFLADLATGGDLLGRQIVLVAREEAAAHGMWRHAGEGRVLQRVAEAARALGAAEITVTPLDAEQSAELVSAACNPDSPAPSDDVSEGDLV